MKKHSHKSKKMKLKNKNKLDLKNNWHQRKIKQKNTQENKFYSLNYINNKTKNNKTKKTKINYIKGNQKGDSKSKKDLKIINICIYVFILTLIISLILINHFSKKIRPALLKYAKTETTRITTLIINNSLDTTNDNLINYDSLLELEKDSNNEIKTVTLNTEKVNRLLDIINNRIQYNIRQVEKGNLEQIDKYFKNVSEIDYERIKNGIVYYIPMGNITGNIFMNNIGPKIPIKFAMSGNVMSNIKSSIKEYGLNNAMIEVDIEVSVSMSINMPFVTEEIKVENSVPIIMKIIQGEIPKYYLGTND